MHHKILFVALGLLLLLTLSWGGMPISKGDFPDQRAGTVTPTVASGDTDRSGSVLSSPGQSRDKSLSRASVSRTSTHRIESYDVFGIMTKSYTTTWAGDIPTPHLHVLNDWDENRISDISFDWTGSGNCVQQSDNDIYCTGDLNSLTISWRYYLTPTVDSIYVHQSVAAWSTFDFDYTFDFFYPSSLVYVTSTSAPNTIIGQNHLRWTRSDIQNFETQITFQDTRIPVVFLPLIIK